MNLKMHENSLFSILLRSPWWLSALVAVGIALAVRAFFPLIYGLFMGLPFAVISAVAAWKQLRAPSAGSIAKTMERLRAMSWEEFSAALEAAWRKEGYEVKRMSGAADFELTKGWQTTLVACKRWKATRTGIEPLRELDAARRKQDAHQCIYMAAGEITDTARAFAAQKAVRLVDGAELAKQLG